jgi:hypothetical protein
MKITRCIRCRWTLFTFWLVTCSIHLVGQNRALCTPMDYKIVSASLIAVLCSEDVSHVGGTGQIYESGSPTMTPLPIDIAIIPYPEALQWLVLTLTSAGATASPRLVQHGKKYKLILTLGLQGQPLDPKIPATAVEIDVSNTVVVNPALALSRKNTFEFVSHLGFKQAPACSLQVQDFSGQTKTIGVHDCRLPAQVPASVSAATIARVAPSPEDIGTFRVTLDNADMSTQQLPYAVPELTDIFDNPVKFDSKSQITPEQAPTSKDASSYYINFNYAAGKGSKPGWVLDGKIAPPVGSLHHGFQFTPLASADVGQNQVAKITYADTINFGGSFSRIYEPNSVLQGLLLSPGITYETDKAFDRHNLLTNPNLRFNFAGLYNTRRRRTLSKFSKELEVAKTRNIPWSTANTRPVLVGYALDFHTGVEVGSAITDTTVKASSGSATILLPRYPIVRMVPRVHGLLEIGKLSLDVTGTGRWLTTVENTVVERPDHTLVIKRAHGWYGYGVFSGSWTFDPAGHFAFTVAYKNGFSPPKFSRVNTVQSGITIKY